jgi:hypothetical protein
MGNMSGIVKQLKKERDHVERQLSGLNAALTALSRYAGANTDRQKRFSLKTRAPRWQPLNMRGGLVEMTLLTSKQPKRRGRPKEDSEREKQNTDNHKQRSRYSEKG